MPSADKLKLNITMKTKLDIQKLIEKAEQIYYDGKIRGASMVTLPIQKIKLNGLEYQLSLNMTLINSCNHSWVHYGKDNHEFKCSLCGKFG